MFGFDDDNQGAMENPFSKKPQLRSKTNQIKAPLRHSNSLKYQDSQTSDSRLKEELSTLD